jgi:hypothetical protein
MSCIRGGIGVQRFYGIQLKQKIFSVIKGLQQYLVKATLMLKVLSVRV